MAKNISKVYLLSVPLEPDYKNTLYFNSLAGQQEYFQSRIVKSYTDFSYQRKDHVIRIPEEYDEIAHVNYIMYQNTAYSNKWFYAFITDLKYVNDGMTEAIIETDVIQTWLFDYQVKPSFVEREHVSNDTIGLHTIPEQVETGTYVSVKAPTKINHYESGTYICVAVSELFSEVESTSGAGNKVYNGIYSGLYYLVCLTSEYASNLIKIYDKKSKADAIYSVFLIPKEFIYNNEIPTAVIGQAEGINYQFFLLPSNSNPVNLLRNTNLETIEYKDVPINNTLAGGYAPRNNKLFTGEFNYMILTNNAGTDIDLRYEDFKNNLPRFKVIGAITPGCSVKCVPINYKTHDALNNIDNSFDYGISGAKFPICSWNSDSYTNWLTQNGVNNAINIGVGAAKIIGGATAIALTGGLGAVVGGTAIGGGIGEIANTLTSMYQHSLVPDQARGNINAGDITYSAGNSVFTAYQVSVKSEYASIIDGYFDMFGYKVNTVKQPNVHHRSRWWYTKCIDVSIDGNIPGNDIQKIKACYNNGIRFWRNASEIENYSLSNGISNIV